MNVRVHSFLMGSRANGPGIRNTVWFQGCTLGCPGCFNPGTHDSKAGRWFSVEQVCARLLDPNYPCDGITISGGEPFQQLPALFSLLRMLREMASPPVLVFSGYIEEEVMQDPARRACAELADALICGPYCPEAGNDLKQFISSRNQKLLLMSDRFIVSDFEDLPLREIIIDEEGKLIISGLIPWK